MRNFSFFFLVLIHEFYTDCSAQFRLAVFQVLRGHMWSVAVPLDGAAPGPRVPRAVCSPRAPKRAGRKDAEELPHGWDTGQCAVAKDRGRKETGVRTPDLEGCPRE